MRGTTRGLAVLFLAGSLSATALAGSSVAPKQTGNPTLQPGGQPYVGDTISISNGSWSNNPTKFTYHWQRCDPVGDRRNCAPITGATSQSYTVAKADVNHKLDGVVTASNADGSASAEALSPVVADTVAPVNRSRPFISGSPVVGSTLTAHNGAWTGAATFSHAWQQCDQNGNNCVAIAGAAGSTYGVRSSDVGHGIRVVVTATNKYGSTRATSNRTPLVSTNTQTTTSVVTTTVAGNKAPSIKFLSLKRVGSRIYARFRACDDSGARVTIIERDSKARALAYTRRFAVSPSLCGTYARNWLLIQRFRSPGRFVVTLRARDNHGLLSALASRSLLFR
jgi:hypothetical protein